MVLKTNHGDIEVTLRPDAAPETVANFVGLAMGTEYTDSATGLQKGTITTASPSTASSTAS